MLWKEIDRSKCVRQCKDWSENVSKCTFPSINGKNKVHDGLDLSAPLGTAVYAICDGVYKTGYSETAGKYIQIKSTKEQHKFDFQKETIFIWYTHLSSFNTLLKNGDVVKAGDLIGYTGNSGSIASKIKSFQYHLHLTIYVGSLNRYNRVNPVLYLTTKFYDNGNLKSIE